MPYRRRSRFARSPEKVRQIFEYSLHDNAISRFRRMMTLEQFRSPELAALYSRRYVERVLAYHARHLPGADCGGRNHGGGPQCTGDAVCFAGIDAHRNLRPPSRNREHECLDQLKRHVSLFFRMVHAKET